MVWLRREDLEDLELRTLGPWAARSVEAGGRRLPEPEDPLRTAFQRDRDRILHCAAFRRLQHKTQVMAAFEGDHFRTRMTHSLEVSQMGRSVATALGLNRDLAEAVALAHDLGHPPFGHAGEEMLDELMQDHGGFRHNAQGLRIVDVLEDRYGHGYGLNLTRVVRRSLLKGRVPPGFPVSADLQPGPPAPLEAEVVDLCDKIAYLSHDLDDGIRAGLFDLRDVGELRLWREAQEQAGEHARGQGRNAVLSEMIHRMIHDLVEATDRSATGADRPVVGFSPSMRQAAGELLAFLQQRFYRAPRVLRAMEDGRRRIRELFQRLLAEPDRLPEDARQRIERDGLHRSVCDYIAGMTDRYLVSYPD